jgi:hypothetical protein
VFKFFIILSLLCFQQVQAKCLSDFHILQKKVKHTLSSKDLEQLDQYVQTKNPADGWAYLGSKGDPYAEVASKVLDPDAVFPSSFYKKLIKYHWVNVNGYEKVRRSFDGTAIQHFSQYVSLLSSGFWPDSDQILLSYLKAVDDHDLPDLTVFDATWESAGFNRFKSWQSLNHLPQERTVYPSRACYDINKYQARKIILKDLLFGGFYGIKDLESELF